MITGKKDFVTGDIEAECLHSSCLCIRDVSIAYITSGNAKHNIYVRRIGVVLKGEAIPSNTFIVEFGFTSWMHSINHKNQILKIQYDEMMEFLKYALLTGDKVDICVNDKKYPRYEKIITDVAIKN